MTDAQTCGRGLAENAVLPAALADAAHAMAENLELHMTALDRSDPASAREHEVYERIAAGLRYAVDHLRMTADDMAAQRALPMGRHDMPTLGSPPLVAAFERLVAAEAVLGDLVKRRAEGHRAMLAAMGSGGGESAQAGDA